MQLLSLLATLSAIILPALTTPLITPRDVNATNSTQCPSGQYYLSTKVIGSGHADKNDLYVSSYHTGNSASRYH